MLSRKMTLAVNRFRAQMGELDGVPGARPCDRVLSNPPVKVQTIALKAKKKKVATKKTPSKMKSVKPKKK